ncbi:MAG: ABC transporter ATP-binding protein [Nitrospinota bacterium]
MDIYIRLLRYIAPYKLKFAIASFFMVLISLTSGSVALLMQPLLDDIFGRKDYDVLTLVAGALLGIYFVRGIARYLASSLMQIVGQLAVRNIRNELHSNMQKLSLSFFNSRKTGEIISRITNDVQLLQEAVSIVLFDIIRESCTMVVLLVILFYQDWQLTLFAIILIPISAVVIIKLGAIIRKISKASQEAMAAINGLLFETFAGIKVVQAFSMENYEIQRFHEVNESYFQTIKRAIRVSEVSSPLLEFLGAISLTMIIWYGGYQVINDKLTAGQFFSFFTALFMLYAPVTKLARANNKAQQAVAAAVRVFNYIDIKSTIVESPNPIHVGKLQNAVEFNNVTFAYDPGKNVVDDVSFTLRQGECVALVGPSGSGKTSLASLLPRFFDSTGGEILFDGTNIKDISINSLRANIGVVTQEIFLFADTIRNNIGYGLDSIDEERLLNASKSAFAHDFILELPDQYETYIGQQGVKLSQGQRQRISIARAIMKDPSILIFDEATSSLDIKSERMVQNAISNLVSSRASIVIAHRLSTIIKADLIIVIEDGKIVEQGSHQLLLSKKGLYKKLYDLQFY